MKTIALMLKRVTMKSDGGDAWRIAHGGWRESPSIPLFQRGRMGWFDEWVKWKGHAYAVGKRQG